MTQEKHIRTISNILIIYGILHLLLFVFVAVFSLWTAKHYMQADNANAAWLPAMLTGTEFLIPLLLFAILHIATGWAFKIQANWARIALWILAILDLGNVPLGTALSAYAIWILINTREDVARIH